MTVLTPPPSPNQPPAPQQPPVPDPSPGPGPTPAPAPQPSPTPSDPMAVIAEVYAKAAPLNTATFEKQAASIEKVGEAVSAQVSIFNAPLPDDEVWLRNYNASCMGGRHDIAEAEADKAVQRYKLRFQRTAVV